MAFLRGFNSKYIQRKPPPTASLLYQCGIRVVLGCRFKKPNSPTNRKIVRLLSTQATTSPSLTPSKPLPSHCPGCGAQSQTLDEKKAGYYSVTGPAVRRYLGVETIGSSKKSREDAVFSTALQDHRKDVMEQVLGEVLQDQKEDRVKAPTPVCKRCHNIIHHNDGTVTYHPTILALEELISSSPFKYNHIYHVIDAADFPMSLLSNLTHRLHIASLRSQNRRSKHRHFTGNRSAKVSFIITRSDLLAGQKEQVDSLMPYLQDVLRSALGYRDKKSRLGNVICVSSERGWWTKNLKESIWQEGGAGWMVGKVNVGKSNLFKAIFPKGRTLMKGLLELDAAPAATSSQPASTSPSDQDDPSESTRSESSSQLPPAQAETMYPVMPLISSVPGTTVSPIRVPYGNGKGELIDLPGLKRGELEDYVKSKYRPGLVMKSRVVARRKVVKSDKTLLLGCLIRITPITSDLSFIMYPFINLYPHIAVTDKAALVHSGKRESGIQSVAENSAGQKMASAGKIKLKWDVTKKFAGPLTTKSAVALKPEQLPFIVFGVDVLIEGCGWVEVTAQVRRKAWNEAQGISGVGKHSSTPPSISDGAEKDDAAPYPEIEIFSPEGRFVSSRKPMCASLFQRKRPVEAMRRKTRPRLSMKSVKARRAPGTPTGMAANAA